MTPVDLFRHYILVGEKAIVELPTIEDAEYLLQLLRTAKSRHCKQMELLGMQDIDPLAGKTISYELVSSTGSNLKISYQAVPLRERVGRVQFTVLKEQEDAASSQ